MTSVVQLTNAYCPRCKAEVLSNERGCISHQRPAVAKPKLDWGGANSLQEFQARERKRRYRERERQKKAHGLNGTRNTTPTPREMQVIDRVAKGMKYKDIGVELGITREGVESLLTHAMQRTGAKNRLELVRQVWRERQEKATTKQELHELTTQEQRRARV